MSHRRHDEHDEPIEALDILMLITMILAAATFLFVIVAGCYTVMWHVGHLVGWW